MLFVGHLLRIRKLLPGLRQTRHFESATYFESATAPKLYGIDDSAMWDYGSRCLNARRLTEVGVRLCRSLLGTNTGTTTMESQDPNPTFATRRTNPQRPW